MTQSTGSGHAYFSSFVMKCCICQQVVKASADNLGRTAKEMRCGQSRSIRVFRLQKNCGAIGDPFSSLSAKCQLIKRPRLAFLLKRIRCFKGCKCVEILFFDRFTKGFQDLANDFAVLVVQGWKQGIHSIEAWCLPKRKGSV